METSGFAPIGLLLAAAMSVTNVMTDVWRKRALDKRDLFPATFWIRIAVAVVFAVMLLAQILRGVGVEIRDAGLLFGLFQLAPAPAFFIYLVLDVGLITIVMWLYFRALQISPLSMCIPFLAFTPVFLAWRTMSTLCLCSAYRVSWSFSSFLVSFPDSSRALASAPEKPDVSAADPLPRRTFSPFLTMYRS